MLEEEITVIDPDEKEKKVEEILRLLLLNTDKFNPNTDKLAEDRKKLEGGLYGFTMEEITILANQLRRVWSKVQTSLGVQ